MHTARTPGPPPQDFQLRKIDALRRMHPAHFTRFVREAILDKKGLA